MRIRGPDSGFEKSFVWRLWKNCSNLRNCHKMYLRRYLWYRTVFFTKYRYRIFHSFPKKTEVPIPTGLKVFINVLGNFKISSLCRDYRYFVFSVSDPGSGSAFKWKVGTVIESSTIGTGIYLPTVSVPDPNPHGSAFITLPGFESGSSMVKLSFLEKIFFNS